MADRVLLVDDNLTNLQVLYQALEQEGYELLVAQSGALRTFGWAAVLGELMAVLVVLMVLPVIMRPRWA